MNLEFSTEICEAIENYEDDTKTELYMLKELYDSTNDETFKENMEEICKQEELCPICFGELEIKTLFEVVGEYMGRPAEQEVTRRVCKHCGNKF